MPREKIRRVIAFVVDDLSLSFESVNYARMAMQKFVEKQMLPGDMVAIIRTSLGISALQLFTADKEQLQAKIATVHWGSVRWDLAGGNLYSVFDGQLATISYIIRALKDLPGRKALILLSAQVGLPRPVSSGGGVDYSYMYMTRYNRLADEALRAGVVIHALDPTGLAGPFSDSLAAVEGRREQARIPLPEKTGGLIVTESNFFVNGIGEVADALKGYYLLSYVPPAGTFQSGRQDLYHRIKVKVRRRGAEVHTRDGFFGSTRPVGTPVAAQNPLRDAIFSPFRYNELNVNVTAGYIEDPREGYMLRSWLHVGARELNMIRKKDEGYIISLEAVCVTSDVNGLLRDTNITKFDFGVREENLQWVVTHGIRFYLSLPVKQPGPYYYRVAVKDLVSGKIGSAYQFVSVPDLRKGKLALSNLFVINKDDDPYWIQSGMTKQTYELSPILRRDAAKSPADRTFRPGESMEYMAVVYNAKRDKGSQPELESQFMLYRNGEELIKGKPEAVNLDESRDLYRILIKKKLLFEYWMHAGDYVLQFQVKDKRAKKKANLAAQTMSFEVLPK
jgi:VWFA-related protein